MGRFFRTSRPLFVDNNIYEHPIQLMQGVLGNAEARTDELVNKADLLEGATDQIAHLNFEEENQRVKDIQSKYNTRIDDLTQRILENPLDYQSLNPELKQLKKDILEDKNSGDWYQVEQRYNSYVNWVKDNEDLRKNNPTLFNKLNNHYYTDIINRASEDPTATFRGQKGIDKPDLIEGYRLHFENIKASATETSDGSYKIKDKWLTEQEVSNIAWNTLISDKNYQGYVNQMGNILGEQGYVDEEGNPMSAFNLVDSSGNNVTFEEYQNLSEEEKKGVRKVLNPSNAFYSDLASVAQTYSFSERTIAEDQYGLVNARGNIQSQLENQRQQGRLQLEGFRQQGRSDLMLQKYALEGEKAQEDFKMDLQAKAAQGDENAAKTLNMITAKETIGVLGNPSANLEEDLQMVNSNREQIELPNGNVSYLYATPGTTEYAAQQRWNNSTTYAINKEGDNLIELSDGTSFKASEYFNWLGDRQHSEELSREFLEKRKGIYLDEGVNTSIASDAINNARWTPEFMKDDAAVDWDRVYQAGNSYEEARSEWYTNYSTQSSQVALQPITNLEVNNLMLNELTSNAENFYMVDSQGNIVENYREGLSNLASNTHLYVTSANAHNEMGIRTNIDGQDYYIFPNNGNEAASNLMTNLSLQGVDANSQYFMEMSNRVSSELLHQMNSIGTNSANTKSIVTKVNGELLSLELVGDKVNVRNPDSNLNDPPEAVFDNMQQFVNAIYAIE